MKFYHTPNLTILNSSLSKVHNNIVRDYEEAKFFREPERAKLYLNKTVYFTEKNIIKSLLELKKDYSYHTTTEGQVENKDISNLFKVDASIGIHNILYKHNYFCINASIVRDNKVISTIFHSPLRDETIACDKKFGLLYNNQKIRPNTPTGYNIIILEQNALNYEESQKFLEHSIQISSALELDIALVCAQRAKGIVVTKESYNKIMQSSCALLIQESKVNIKENTNLVVIGNIS